MGLISGIWELLAGVWSFIGRIFKRIGEWLKKPHDWWRITAFIGAAVSAWLAVQWTGAEREAEAAKGETVRVRTEYVEKLRVVEIEAKTKVERVESKCKVDRANAVAVEYSKRLEAEKKVRDLEHRLADAVRAIDAKYQKEKQDAKREGKAVAAGIVDGSLQLRDEWTDDAATPSPTPPSNAPVGGSDDRTKLQAASAGRIIEVVGTCDAQVRNLQTVVREYLSTNEAP